MDNSKNAWSSKRETSVSIISHSPAEEPVFDRFFSVQNNSMLGRVLAINATNLERYRWREQVIAALWIKTNNDRAPWRVNGNKYMLQVIFASPKTGCEKGEHHGFKQSFSYKCIQKLYIITLLRAQEWVKLHTEKDHLHFHFHLNFAFSFSKTTHVAILCLRWF